eukprot:GHUV01036863.1.p2 GENE.GHUV01036863.1~~GHUV01036863.1.p2  ORF type:complete len:121 (-),score=24.28 GHUV01036863.1:194-556(-)
MAHSAYRKACFFRPHACRHCSIALCLHVNELASSSAVQRCIYCRYAADQLTWLVTRSLGNAPMDVMARLQEDIDECDRKGGRNADIDADEKVDEWVSIVTAGVSRQDVEEMVLPLIQAAV